MTFLSFKLSDDFVTKYADRKVNWGLIDAGGTSFSELVFLMKYSRKKPDGSKETWTDVCRRVVEGTYSIQKDWAKSHHLPWNDHKAQRSAEEMFERMYEFKWTPPGRGLQNMGTHMVNGLGYSSALQNCGAISLGVLHKNNPGEPFAFLMGASMMGVGIGYSTIGIDETNLTVHQPEPSEDIYVIPDTREGWAEATRRLINSYWTCNGRQVTFDYSLIRPKGAEIKTFGTRAPGPEPLKKLHNKLREIFDAKIGQKVDSVLLVDVANLTGKCVVSGNTRRSALLAYGELDDKDFISVKDWRNNHERTGLDGWAGYSNNSVRASADSDLSSIVESIQLNGEPGIIWEDVVKTRGRLADPPDDKDAKFVSMNPCLVGSTLLLTENGWRRFDTAEKEATPNILIVDSRVTYQPSEDGKEHAENWKVLYTPGRRGTLQEASKVFVTQRNAEVVRIETKEGYEVTLTPDHLVATPDGMVEAGKLTSSSKVLLTAGPLPTDSIVGRDPETVEEIEAALMGLVAGDGTFSPGKSTHKVYVTLWGEDRAHADRIVEWVNTLFAFYGKTITSQGTRPFTACSVCTVDDRNQVMISSSFLAALLESKYGFKRETKHIVPELIMENARTYGRYYIAGLAFADGTVNKYNKVNSSSARINQSNKPLLQQVQKMLLANGIASTIYLRRAAKETLLPDGKGGSALYPTKPNYDLLVMNHKYEFGAFFGFLGSHKDALIPKYLGKESRKRAPFLARVTQVVAAGREDVYCLQEPVRRILCADGITMRRCSEQPLENNELCTLADIYVNNHIDLDDFRRTVKFAFLYAKTVTLLPTHFEESNAVMQRNRRIGLSLSGITDFIDGRRNGLQQIREWFAKGYPTVRYYDEKYSAWLGVRESNRVTTIKPGGTTGLIAATSAGIHWTDGGEYYERALRVGNDDPVLRYLEQSGHRCEPDVMNPDNTTVVYFPIKSRAKRSAYHVSLFEKAALAVEAQRLWSDNAVSVTLTFDSEKEKEAVATVLNMYAGQLKAVSFLPVGNEVYPQQPYTEITQEQYDEAAMTLFPTLLDELYKNWGGADVADERFCNNDTCTV